MERAYRAVLFIDVVDSVRLIEQDEEGFISRWLGIIDYIERSIVPKIGGRIVKRLGDGMLLEFADVRTALSAAFEVQRATERDNATVRPPVGPDNRMLLRMGIEVSDIIVGRDDIYGRAASIPRRA